MGITRNRREYNVQVKVKVSEACEMTSYVLIRSKHPSTASPGYFSQICSGLDGGRRPVQKGFIKEENKITSVQERGKGAFSGVQETFCGEQESMLTYKWLQLKSPIIPAPFGRLLLICSALDAARDQPIRASMKA
jgi:hypothetical protein